MLDINSVLVYYQAMACEMRHCDEFITDISLQPVTYFDDNLNHSSFIDHMFVSDSFRSHVVAAEIYDSGTNLSDHRPLVLCIRCI